MEYIYEKIYIYIFFNFIFLDLDKTLWYKPQIMWFVEETCVGYFYEVKFVYIFWRKKETNEKLPQIFFKKGRQDISKDQDIISSEP